MKHKILISIFISFLFCSVTLAHQPRIVSKNFTEIKNPEVSQAFYAELKGEPDYYQIISSEPFSLYVSILAPDLEGIDTDVVAEIYQGDADRPQESDFYYKLDGQEFAWTPFYEEFAGDDYLQGPELKDQSVETKLPRGIASEAGTYNIKVSSPDNLGKYVIVVGEKEEFPPAEIWQTLKTLPGLKKDFFEKPAYTAYFNLIGLFLLLSAFVAIIILFAGAIIIRKIIKNRRK